MSTKGRALCCCVLLGMAAAAAQPTPADSIDWTSPWTLTHDAQAARKASAEHAWRTFVAVNWPADLRTGSADSRSSLHSDAVTVWETWRNVNDIFLLEGRDPGPWQLDSPASSDSDEMRFDSGRLAASVPAKRVVAGALVAFDPVGDATHLNETRLNRTAFEYIRDHELYDLDGQLSLLRRGIPPVFPAESVEVKAQWRPIATDQRARYHTLTITLRNGQQRLLGLTALHIATKDLPNWFWATFEHEDNESSVVPAESWVHPSRDEFACRGDSSDCNRAPRGIGLDGTVWEHYRLRGTMVSALDAQGRPALLANSQLEAGVQHSASCVTCHARASIGLIDGKAARLTVLDARGEPLEGDSRRGFVGSAQDTWFFSHDEGRAGERVYLPLDSVWSLAKAQPRSSP
jgi:hypothetical protein